MTAVGKPIVGQLCLSLWHARSLTCCDVFVNSRIGTYDGLSGDYLLVPYVYEIMYEKTA